MNRKILAVVMSICMVMTMFPMTAAAAESGTAAPEYKEKTVYANGVGIVVDASGVYVDADKDGEADTADSIINDGAVMSEITIYGGAENAENNMMSPYITMSSGTVAAVYTGNKNDKFSFAQVYITGDVTIGTFIVSESAYVEVSGTLNADDVTNAGNISNSGTVTVNQKYTMEGNGYVENLYPGEIKGELMEYDNAYSVTLIGDDNLDTSIGGYTYGTRTDGFIYSTDPASVANTVIYLKCKSGYELDTITVEEITRDVENPGQTITTVLTSGYTYDAATGKVTIDSLKGNLKVTATSKIKSSQPVEKPVAVTTTVMVASGVKAKVKTNVDQTAVVTAVNKTTKKTITLKAEVTVKGVSYKITTINKNAFKNCARTTKIVLPDTIKKINKNAFYGAKNLKIVKFAGTKAPAIAKGAFGKLATKKMTVQVNSKMAASEFNQFKKTLKNAGFRGTIKKVK